MVGIFQFVLFVIFTFYVLIKGISYGLYEIQVENNKTGGIFVIAFSFIAVIFSIFAMIIS